MSTSESTRPGPRRRRRFGSGQPSTPADPAARPAQRPVRRGPDDPARQADRPAPDEVRAGRHAGRAGDPGRGRGRGAGPLHRGRPDRRRRLRQRVGRVTPPWPRPGQAGTRPGASRGAESTTSWPAMRWTSSIRTRRKRPREHWSGGSCASMRSLDRQVAMRRLLGMLARKGYPGGLAMTIIKQETGRQRRRTPTPQRLRPRSRLVARLRSLIFPLPLMAWSARWECRRSE